MFPDQTTNGEASGESKTEEAGGVSHMQCERAHPAQCCVLTGVMCCAAVVLCRAAVVLCCAAVVLCRAAVVLCCAVPLSCCHQVRDLLDALHHIVEAWMLFDRNGEGVIHK